MGGGRGDEAGMTLSPVLCTLRLCLPRLQHLIFFAYFKHCGSITDMFQNERGNRLKIGKGGCDGAVTFLKGHYYLNPHAASHCSAPPRSPRSPLPLPWAREGCNPPYDRSGGRSLPQQHLRVYGDRLDRGRDRPGPLPNEARRHSGPSEGKRRPWRAEDPQESGPAAGQAQAPHPHEGSATRSHHPHPFPASATGPPPFWAEPASGPTSSPAPRRRQTRREALTFPVIHGCDGPGGACAGGASGALAIPAHSCRSLASSGQWRGFLHNEAERSSSGKRSDRPNCSWLRDWLREAVLNVKMEAGGGGTVEGS